MFKRLLIATSNEGKLKEIRKLLEPLGMEVIMPEKALEVEEGGQSFLENAYIKARAYYERYGVPVLAEDSGLVIPALEGYPGVYSSRFYSLEWGGMEEVKEGKDQANIRKVLRLMKGIKERSAYFVAFALLYTGDGGLWGEGRCEGYILEEPRGYGGFGYDPIFQPAGYEKSMAELSLEEKNLISHRGKALRRLLELIAGNW
jgi:XTP/dITP diphosphohydrolase